MRLNLDQLFALAFALIGSLLFGMGVTALYLDYMRNTFAFVAVAGFTLTVIGAYILSASADK